MRTMLLIAGLSTLLCQTSCKSSKEVEEEKTKFLVTEALQMDTTVNKNYVCQIMSISHIDIRSQERGYLERIYVDEGQFVHKGQLLFQIMPKLFNAELQKAQAEADLAEIEFKNTKQLADKNVVSPNELAMAKAKFDRAKADVSLAQVHLGFTQIVAPFDGIIDRFHVRLGSLIDEGDLLTELSDNSKMWVYYNVPEAEYLEYTTHIKTDADKIVNLQMANNKMFDFPGVVETIEANFNNETGNIAFRATFPNPKKLLRHGETGNIVTTIPLPKALLIPQKSTFEVLDKKYVFVVDKDNVIHSREVTVLAELPHIYAISSGLKTNDKILLEGLRLVKENEKIECTFVPPAKALSQLELYAE